MFFKTLLLLMAANVLSAGHIGHPENRIIGGSNTAIEAAPWQVFLQKLERGWISDCGGSLIRPDIVLTAGHCVISNGPAEFSVRVGSSNKNKGGQLFTVAKIVVHPDYKIDNTPIFLNDIALVRLSNPVKIGPTAQTIALATHAPPAGAQALITGWGRILHFVTEGPIILQGINVTIVPSDECTIFPWINEKIICAGSKGKTTCDGDSGGALVVNNQVVGVVSAGVRTCDTPTIYVNVPYYHQWILGAIKELYL
nr:trypsin-like [Drosophila bipectinata]